MGSIISSKEELEKFHVFPSDNRLKRGPVPVIECIEEIPCNICEPACPVGAIEVGSPITNLPKLIEDKCIGCGRCVAACPGLAIFMVDANFSEREALISFPYEFLPMPEVGAVAEAVERQGRVVTKGRIVKVRKEKGFDHTLIVSISVPKEFLHDVRGIALPKKR